MSRNVLIVTVVLGVLVATLVAPAMAAPLRAGVVPDQTEASVSFSSSRSVSLLSPGLTPGAIIWPNGGCETGAAGGCPIHT
jgi:hypothetical protein